MLRPLTLLLCLVYLLAVGAPARAAEGDGLLDLMSGEFALQEGRFAEAALAYAAAAERSEDPGLAERAARVALLADDPVLAARALERWLALAPDAAGAQQMAAVLALREGRSAAAIAALTALFADGEQGWRFALQALVGERASPAVGSVLAALVASDALPPAAEPTLAFGGLAQRLGQVDAAATLAERVTERHPRLPRAWLWRAEIERQLARTEASRTSIERALELPDLDTPLRLAAAAQLDALGEPAAAAKVLAGGEQDDATLAGRAAYLARAESGDELAALYEELRGGSDPHPPARLYLLGQLAELRKQSDDALAWYRLVADDPVADQAQLRIAMVLDERGELDEAIRHLQAYQGGDSENGEALVNAYLLEAELLNRRGRHAEALAVYERGLATFEEDPELLYARALGFERLDRVDEAISDLRRLLAMDPDNPDTLNALGYTLADRTERFDEALELITRALAAKPDSPAIMDSMGWVLFRLGRTDEALPHLQRAFELQRDAEVAAHLGEVLWVSGKQEEARNVWRLGEEIDSDNRALRRTLERFAP